MIGLISVGYLLCIAAVACLLFIFVIRGEQGRYFLMCTLACTTCLIGIHLDRGQEYEIKLINEKQVEVHSFISGKTYHVAPDKITETIDKDNL